MKVLYIEGPANHDDPESCVGVPRGRSEALTGGVWAGLLSREISVQFGMPTLCHRRKATPLAALSRAARGPARSKNPGTHDRLHAREPGDPMIATSHSMMPRP